MNPYDTIGMAGSGERIICPFCNGGMTRERSMVVWGPEHYKCFRASCGKAGWGTGGVQPREKQARYFTKPTLQLTRDQAEFLCILFGLDSAPSVSYSPDEDRYIFDVLAPMGWLRGHMARSYSGQTPKTLAYRAKTEEPWMHWSKPRDYQPLHAAKPVVVVEDIVSAEKVAQFGLQRGCALLGTHMDVERAEEIRQLAGNKPVHIALDKDATGLAIKHYNKFGDIIPNLFVLALDKDIKDMSRAETWSVLKYAADSASARRDAKQQECV